MFLSASIGLVAALFALLLCRHHRPFPYPATLLIFPLLGFLATAAAALTFQVRTDLDWNSVRAVASVALSLGYPIYYPPGQGPLWGIIYPPLGFILSLPIALGSTASSAIRIGQALSLGWVLIPLGCIALLPSLRPPNSSRVIAVVAVVVLAACALVSIAPLTDAAFNVHIDAPAIGLSLFATLLLLAATQRGPRSPFLLAALAGALAVASVFTKQTLVATPLALLAFTLLPAHRALLRPFLVGAAVSAVALSAVCLIAFSPSAMLYNTFTVPSRHGFRGGLLAALQNSLRPLALYLLPVATVALVIRFLIRPSSPSHAAPERLFLLLAAAQFPLALAGFLKVGGGPNNLAPPALFLLAALLHAAARALLHPATPRRTPILSLLFFSAACLSLWRVVASANDPILSRPDQHASSYAALRASPGLYYFPRLPLTHLLAEIRLTHHTWGLTDRENSGETVSPEWLLLHTPPTAQYLAYHTRAPGPTVPLHTRLLPTFPQSTMLPELPGWLVFSRPPTSPTVPPSPATAPAP